MDEQNRWLPSELINVMLEQSSTSVSADIRQILLNFLEVLDSLDRLVKLTSSIPQQSESEASNWSNHLQTLREQLLKVFEQAGVTFFDCVGQPFDPERHKAVETIERRDIDNYTVIEQVTRGCEWHGTILRIAQVIVAKCPNKLSSWD